MNTDVDGRASSPRPLLYRRAYDLAVKALADAGLCVTGSDTAELMRRLVAGVQADRRCVVFGDGPVRAHQVTPGVRPADGCRLSDHAPGCSLRIGRSHRRSMGASP